LREQQDSMKNFPKRTKFCSANLKRSIEKKALKIETMTITKE